MENTKFSKLETCRAVNTQSNLKFFQRKNSSGFKLVFSKSESLYKEINIYFHFWKHVSCTAERIKVIPIASKSSNLKSAYQTIQIISVNSLRKDNKNVLILSYRCVLI